MPIVHTLAVLTDEVESRLVEAIIGLIVALTWWLRAQPKFRSARRRAIRKMRERRKRKEKTHADTSKDSNSGQP
jgi:chemotaxis methyl-accepting protein methylase